MKKLSTKTIATLTVVTAAAAAVPGISRALPRSNESQFDKLLQRHDRKGEIRAEILGIAPHEFKRLMRHMSFDSIISRAGMTKRTFRLALLASLRNELRIRGWTTAKIDSYIKIRSPRTLPVALAV